MPPEDTTEFPPQVQRILQFVGEHRLPVPEDRAEADTRLQKIASRVYNYWHVPYAYLVSDEGQDLLFELCEDAAEWTRVLNGYWTDEEEAEIATSRHSGRYGARPKSEIRERHRVAVAERISALLEGAARVSA